MSVRNLSAISNVLNTVELVESIFLQLSPEDLLFAAYVCKDWQDLISTSLAIQTSLRKANYIVHYVPGTRSSKNSISYFITINLNWGKLLIRGLNNIEVIGALVLDSKYFHIVDGKNKKAIIEREDRRRDKWKVVFCDVGESKEYVEYVVCGNDDLGPTACYLERHH